MVAITVLVLAALCLGWYFLRKRLRKRHQPIPKHDSQQAASSNHSSSTMSVYDQIELYERADRASMSITPYTVLTRDPYAYEELYRLRVEEQVFCPSQSSQDSQPGNTHSRKRSNSLPTYFTEANLNEYGNAEDHCYIRMLPEKLEADAVRMNDIQITKSKSLSTGNLNM